MPITVLTVLTHADLIGGYLVAALRGDSKVNGTVTFEQSDENSPTTVSWNITGHDANAERGMHVHAYGDNSNGCTSAGPHCEYMSTTSGYAGLWKAKSGTTAQNQDCNEDS